MTYGTIEVRPTGSDTNGGGFDVDLTGTDYSQQDAAQATGTNMVVDSAPNNYLVSPDGHTCVAADVGNYIYTDDAGTIKWYRIIAINGTTKWQVAGTMTADATGITWSMGGALASPGAAGKCVTDIAITHTIFIKAATYTLTTATFGTGGPFRSNSSLVFVRSYVTARTDVVDEDSAKAIIDAGAITNVILWHQDYANMSRFWGLKADGQGNAGVDGFKVDYGGGKAVHCEAVDCVVGFTFLRVSRCVATGCSSIGFSVPGQAIHCIADTCGTGFYIPVIMEFCLAVDCTVRGIYLDSVNDATHCTVDGCDEGIRALTYCSVESCIITNSTTQGIKTAALGAIENCASDNAGTTADDDSNAWPIGDDYRIDITSDPYVDRAGGDYSINDTWLATLTVRTGIPGHGSQPVIGAVQPVAGGAAGMLRRSSQRGGYE